VNYIFDLDGTLVETTLLHADTFVKAFREEGKIVDKEKVKSLIGLSGIEIAKILGSKDPKKLYDRKVELFIQRVDEVKEKGGATKTLSELKKRGNTICIATSSGKRMANAILSRFKWPIDFLITAEDVREGKPHPEMLNLIKEKFQGPHIMIGDTHYDRETAEAARISSRILGQDIKKLSDLLIKT